MTSIIDSRAKIKTFKRNTQNIISLSKDTAQLLLIIYNQHTPDFLRRQQFQYREEPTYKWSLGYFKKLEIGEWDSFCEKCLMEYSKKSSEIWNESKNTKV